MFIREHNGHKYQIDIQDEKAIIAASSFAGIPVKGIAKCDPNDVYDIEKGIKLAIRRCDEKIAVKKMARGQQKLAAAEKEYLAAKERLEMMQQYADDAEINLVKTSKELADYLNIL